MPPAMPRPRMTLSLQYMFVVSPFGLLSVLNPCRHCLECRSETTAAQRFCYILYKKLTGRLLGGLSTHLGSGRRIRTLTYGVRVRCATLTQSRYVLDERYSLYSFGGICQEDFEKNLKKFLRLFWTPDFPLVPSAFAGSETRIFSLHSLFVFICCHLI